MSEPGAARQHQLPAGTDDASDHLELWFDLAALVLAAPSGYVFPGHGPLVMILVLVLGGGAGSTVTRLRRQRAAAEAAEKTVGEKNAEAHAEKDSIARA